MPIGLGSITGEIQINTYYADNQDEAQSVFIPGHGARPSVFGVVFESDGFAGQGNDVLFRALHLDGTFATDEFALVSPVGFQNDPRIAVLSDGRPIISWEQDATLRGTTDLMTLIGDRTSATVEGLWSGGAGPQLAYFGDAGAVQNLDLVALNDGGYLTGYEQVVLPVMRQEVAIGLFGSQGERVTRRTFDAGLDDIGLGSIVQRADGAIQVIFFGQEDLGNGTFQGQLRSQLYAPDTLFEQGTSTRFEGQGLTVFRIETATLADGRVLAVYDAEITGTEAPLFVAGGLIGPDSEIIENFGVMSDENGRVAYDPDVAATPDGGFVMVWASGNPTDFDDQNVMIRRFDIDANPVGPSMMVNTATAGRQYQPQVSVSPSGEILVTWDADDLFGPDLTNVRSRMYQLDELGTPGITRMGTSGADSLAGTEGNDTLEGGDGADFLDGSAGFDVLRGGLGNDFYLVSSRADRIEGELAYALGGGIDTVRSFVSYVQPDNIELIRLGFVTDTDDLNATGNDAPGTLVGNAGNNRLIGRGGNDQINGNDGDDILIGNTGRDTLVGGAGADTFVYTSISESRTGSAARDVINGFDRGQDKIDLSGLDSTQRQFDIQPWEFISTLPFGGSGRGFGTIRLQNLGEANAVLVEGDLNNDGSADFQILVTQVTRLDAFDFIF